MPDLTPQQWGAIGLAVAAAGTFAYSHIGDVKEWFGKWTSADPKSARKAALANFDDAIGYLEDQHCTEGVNAMKAALPHFYSEHPHEEHPA